MTEPESAVLPVTPHPIGASPECIGAAFTSNPEVHPVSSLRRSNPINRGARWLYRPVLRGALRFPVTVALLDSEFFCLGDRYRYAAIVEQLRYHDPFMVCADFAAYLQAEREAYGPSRNEGLCYESCQRVSFAGDLAGDLYLCMDGYTKLKLLPRILGVQPALKLLYTGEMIDAD